MEKFEAISLFRGSGFLSLKNTTDNSSICARAPRAMENIVYIAGYYLSLYWESLPILGNTPTKQQFPYKKIIPLLRKRD